MYLGIDIGTSGVKSVILSDDGKVAAQATAPLDVMRPKPLHAEQHPEDWWRAADQSVLGLPSGLRAEVRGIGLSGQMHGATFLDGGGKVLRPAILWNDGRSAQECRDLEEVVPESRALTGNLAMPGFTAPKALWVRKHEPEIFAQTQTILLPKDYVRYRMTGALATDLSDASGTLWLNVGERSWSERMLEACGLSLRAVPRLFEGSEVTGELSREIASAWGMKSVPVVAGGGDNAAGAVGAGVLRDGDAFLSLGTSGVLFAAGERFRPNPERGIHAFCHALPGRWHEMTVMLSAASCLDWAAALTGIGDVAALIERAQEAKADSELLFLPYLSGERTPHNDPLARGVFFGLSHDTGPAEIARSVLEGVAFGLADGMAALGHAANVETISVIGGGSRSAYWGDILAAALGKPLLYRRDSDVGPALGAAKLAQLGLSDASESEVCAPPPILDRVDPDPGLRERLLPKFARFREVYRCTSHLFEPRTPVP